MIELKVPNEPTTLRAAAEFFASLCNCVVEPRAIRPDYIKDDMTPTEQMSAIINSNSTKPDEEVTNNKFQEFVAGLTLVTDKDGMITGVDNTNQCGNQDPGNIFEQATRKPAPTVVSHQTKDSNGDWSNQTPSPDLDAAGMPWDSRINASSKSKVADGTWRLKKCPKEMNKEQWDTFVAGVQTELKQLMNIPAPEPSDTTPPAAPGIKTIAELTNAIFAASKSPAQVQEAYKSVGIDAFPLLGGRPDLIPDVAKALEL
jgi:hypothetical protein